MPVLRASIGTFNAYAQSLSYTICHLQLVHTHVFCFYWNSGNPAENELNCFYFTSRYVHILPTDSTFRLQMGQEDWKEKALWVVLSFPFLPRHHFQHKGWTTIGTYASKRGCVGLFGWGHSHFLQYHCLPSAFETCSGSYGEHGLPGLSMTPIIHSQT